MPRTSSGPYQRKNKPSLLPLVILRPNSSGSSSPSASPENSQSPLPKSKRRRCGRGGTLRVVEPRIPDDYWQRPRSEMVIPFFGRTLTFPSGETKPYTSAAISKDWKLEVKVNGEGKGRTTASSDGRRQDADSGRTADAGQVRKGRARARR